jgi:predicted aspartyl protease
MRQVCALLAACLLVSGCAESFILDDDNAIATIPYRINASGDIIVETMINDQGPFDFALDTGASISVIFDNIREQTGLALLEGDTVLIHGMVGSGKFPLTSVDRLQVGGVSWAGTRIACIPGDTPASSGIDGILGIDFLSRYAIWFSSDQEIIRFHDPGQVADQSYWGWSSIPLRRLQIGSGDATAYAIDLSIAGQTVPALFDLGANTNLMNWRAAQAVGARPAKTRRHDKIHGAFETASATATLYVRRLKITNLYWHDRSFLVADFPIFEILELDDQPAAIVGSGFFKKRDFVVDIARDRLLIKASWPKHRNRDVVLLHDRLDSHRLEEIPTPSEGAL